MADTRVKAALQGLMEQIRKSRYPLAPLYEAISNSLEAIFQKKFSEDELPLISIKFEFTGLLQEKNHLTRIVIQDNGVGFDKVNFARFETLLDRSKGYNNRGSGRIQFIHRFGRIDVISFYSEDGVYFRRSFSCSRKRFVYDKNLEQDPLRSKSGTTLSLIAEDALGRDREYFDDITLDELIGSLKTHLLLRCYLQNEGGKTKVPPIEINFVKNGKIFGQGEIRQEDMPQPVETGVITVFPVELRDPYSVDIEWKPVIGEEKELQWANFKLTEKEIARNSVWLCSQGVTVTRLNYDIVRIPIEAGHRFRFHSGHHSDLKPATVPR